MQRRLLTGDRGDEEGVGSRGYGWLRWKQYDRIRSEGVWGGGVRTGYDRHVCELKNVGGDRLMVCMLLYEKLSVT